MAKIRKMERIELQRGKREKKVEKKRKEKKAPDPILSNFFKQKSFSIEHDIFEIKFKTQFDSRVTSKLFLPTRGY
jgi:hypothetical protein